MSFFFLTPGFKTRFVFLMSKVTRQLVQQCRRVNTMRTFASAANELAKPKKRLVFDNRSPSFQDFLAGKQKPIDRALTKPDDIPYLQTPKQMLGKGKKFYIEVYGCQASTFFLLNYVLYYQPFGRFR
jgi:hypothetical protein